MIILHGTFERADGSPAVGVLDIRPVLSASDLTPAPVIVTQAPVLVTLDAAGGFEVVLRASDDDGWATDQPVAYRVMRMLDGERTVWGTYLLLGVMGERVDLARLTPITEGAGIPVPVPVPGLSAYEVAVEAGFVGTEEEWLASLHGRDGVPPVVRVVQTITAPAGGAASVVDVDPTDDVGLVVTIPTGGAGPAGPPNTLAVGTVTTGAPGSQAAASITGQAPAQTLHLTLPAGQVGAAGPAIGGLLTTKGDMVARDATTAVRVPVGSNGQVLVADSTAPAGVRWAGMVRTSRPNTDDRLVEVWDGTKWVVTHYDSGWRNIAASVTPGSGTTLNLLRVQRTTAAVNYIVSWNQDSSAPPPMQWAAPAGFRAAPNATDTVWQILSTTGTVTGRLYTSGGSTMNFQPLPGGLARGFVSHPTTDTTLPPTTLPGTLIAPAP